MWEMMELIIGGKQFSVNGKENIYKIGLGIFVNDGSFPSNLAAEKFSCLVSVRGVDHSKR